MIGGIAISQFDAIMAQPTGGDDPQKMTWSRVLQAGYNDQIYNNSNNNNNNVFSRSGATHDRRAATTPVRCADEMGRCQRRPFSMVRGRFIMNCVLCVVFWLHAPSWQGNT